MKGKKPEKIEFACKFIKQLMTNPLDGRNTKKLKKLKLNC